MAQAYLEFLYSPEGQEIAAKHFYRPRLESVAQKYAGTFPKVKLFTIDEVFGGWQKAQKTHFSEGGCSTRSSRRTASIRGCDIRFTALTVRNESLSLQGVSGMAHKRFKALPGFGLTMGFTLFYLSAMVLIPFAGAGHPRTLEFPGRISGAWPPPTARWQPTG